jgi:hypothetical protein
MQIKNSVRTRSLASMMVFSVMSPLAVQVHAEDNTGSGSGSAKFQCETNAGDFDPATGVGYKQGTKVDTGTTVTNSDTHKKYKCVDQQGWVEQMIFTPPTPSHLEQVGVAVGNIMPLGTQSVGMHPTLPGGSATIGR